MDRKSQRSRVLAVGPTPPPYNGMSVATSFLLRTEAAESLGIRLVDIADRRGLGNVGKFDIGNVAAALSAGLRFAWALLVVRPAVVYVPVAQNRLGFVRDAQFLLLARLFRRSVVIHIHGGHFGRFYAESGPVMRRLIHVCVSRAHAAVVLGDCLRDMLTGLVSPERVHVVPNGIDDFGLERSDVPRDAARVVWLSKMDPTKGYLDLLHTAPRVIRDHPDAQYVFAGEWLSDEDRNAAQEFVARHGLAQGVTFRGPLGSPEKYDMLAGSGVFALPTRYRYEGQPYSILEAMSCSLPVVSSPAGCISETVLDGVTGFLVEAGDVEGIADRVSQLLGDPGLRESMGVAGRRRFLEEYTFSAWDRRVSSILTKAVESVDETRRSAS